MARGQLTRTERIENRRIDLAFHKRCLGVQIPMMKIPDIFKLGRQVIRTGADDATLEQAIAEYVETIRAG